MLLWLIKPQAGGSNVQEHNVSGWYRKSIIAALGDDGSGSNPKDANPINPQLQMRCEHRWSLVSIVGL